MGEAFAWYRRDIGPTGCQEGEKRKTDGKYVTRGLPAGALPPVFGSSRGSFSVNARHG